ncbi:MAG: hypothetical protein CFE41_09740 [Burkholderiales bacterium PBB2]|nr:MAG: hypothetical protein CFE41_09740 [Burkholderiales bacterium PBB2]
MSSQLTPKRNAFFELLASHTTRMVAGGNATLRLITGLGQPGAQTAELIEEVHEYETSADKILEDLILLLYESFTTPINRDQLHTLALDLDRVLDELQHVCNAVGAYRINETTQEARTMAALVADACLRLDRAVLALPDKTRGQETLDLCKEIDRIEHEVDTLRKRAIKAMFEQEGDDAAAWRAIKLRELYSLLETVMEACKRAAGTIEEILIENA